MASRENELKYELTEDSYSSLLATFEQAKDPLRFLNTYFVVEADTGRRDWVMRLRREPQTRGGELTLKIGRQLSPGVFCSEESSVRVDTDEPSDWEGSEPVRLFRREISGEPLRLQGEALNERRFLKAPFGPVRFWEIDRTELPNGEIHHELEIEYPPQIEPTLEEISLFREQLEGYWSQKGWPLVASRKTKYRRFLDAVES